ncbi:hypothetical protein RJ639_018012 [Escallonia herrerae]|uniref:Retrovirus-related Pol polyprotein from transposon TNT 1-94-like beta-barrel domain-containing protein n=1 Tax=Escallonia herrerae TaxID=1293975 RepID=A0AA88VAZ9_9ASTE|nr:hypothetical protein RJ639_018012 [Escallonia herrerae]
MTFLLTALKVQYVLDPNLPSILEIIDNDSDETKEALKKREDDELVCRGHILNSLSDRLYDLFTSSKSPREIWKALENKYNNEKQGAYKFLTLKYFEFTMNDNESVLDQVHQLQILVSKLKDLKVEIGMITELHMATSSKNSDWWYDFGATVHVCNENSFFKDYEEATDGQVVLMRNHSSVKVLGKGSVELQITLGKKLVLLNVLHVLKIRKNLVSASLLCKKGVKALLESDKLDFVDSVRCHTLISARL